MATKNVELIEIRPIEIQKTTIRIVGDTPLIMHAWSEKAKVTHGQPDNLGCCNVIQT